MTELMVIFVIALLVLGPKRLPGLARSLGKGLAEFRRASTDMRREFLDVAEDVRIDPNSFTAESESESQSEQELEQEPEEAAPESESGAQAKPTEQTPGPEPRTAGKQADD